MVLDAGPAVEPFAQTLGRHGLTLIRGRTTTLQINVGLVCNQMCAHCHLEAGPHRPEIMGREVMDQVVAYQARHMFETVDITGGAPELNPLLPSLIEELAPIAPRIMLRANLTALADPGRRDLMGFLASHRVTIVASFPSLSPGQTEALRGRGVFNTTLATLLELGRLGYGRPGSGLELDLVVNPAGAFLPPSQAQTEERFRKELARRFGITFNQLYALANVPLGRYRRWLEKTGNYQRYLERLVAAFNPCTIEGLMCRRLVSVSWDGHLFDCDFNLAAGLPLGGRSRHVRLTSEPPTPGQPIAVSDHCYTCTAGSGFT